MTALFHCAVQKDKRAICAIRRKSDVFGQFSIGASELPKRAVSLFAFV